MIAKGLPRESTYTLLQWPVTQKGPTENLRGVTLDESGQAVCAAKPGTCSPDKPDDPIDLVFNPVAGAPYRLALVSSQDKNIRALTKIVPVPIQAEDKGCTLQSVLLTPGAEFMAIEGSGFAPNHDVRLESESGKEHHGGTVRSDREGRLVTGIVPYIEVNAGEPLA